MENNPADFICAFYNGIKINLYTGMAMMEIKMPNNSSDVTKQLDDTVFKFHNVNSFDVDARFLDWTRHVKQCHVHCLNIEKKASKSTNVKYPIVLKSSGQNRPRSSPTSIYPSVCTFASQVSRTTTRANSQTPSVIHKKSLKMTNQMNSHFIKDVGWCIQTPIDQFAMLFQDGIQVIVDPKSQSLEYIDDSKQMYSLFNLDT
jgi:hypothetical protein